MVKRALCVGINSYPIAGMDLYGCVNDATAWAALLKEHYDFAKADIRVLTDRAATKRAIVGGLGELLSGARSGDVLVFTNSSHGTYLADRDGDDALYDEALCPYDTSDAVLVDDELRELFADLPRGVRLTVISDSCHSGSLTREPPGAALLTPDQRRKRYIDPKVLGRRDLRDVRRTAAPRRGSVYPEAEMKELLLSGCRSDQYSYDARFGRTAHGAMTYTALALIEAAGYRLSYRRLHRALGPALGDAGFDQEPQLEGRVTFKRRQVFT